MSTPAQLRAEADTADCQADAIFARIDAASAAAKPDAFGNRPLVPTGHEADAAHASELRQTARVLRQEATEIEAESSAPRPSTKASGSVIAGGSVADPIAPVAGAGIGNTPPPAPAPDPEAEIDAAAKRILASDGPAQVPASGDADVDAVAKRIAASDIADDGEADADAIAERILGA